MSTEFPSDPREALEASLTALLLGELPEDQAAFVRQAMAQDAELARRYERLKCAIEMVRLAEARPAAMPGEQPPALKLSDQRREALLQRFKTVAPVEFVQPKQRRTNWLVPAGIAALLIAVLSIALLPALSKSKSRSMVTARAALDERVLRERLESSKQPTSGGMEGDRDLNRKAGSAEQKVQLAEARTEIVLPAGIPQETAGREFTGKEVAGGSGGGRLPGSRQETLAYPGGSFGGMVVPEKPPVSSAEPGNATAAEKRFMQRYGLAAGSFGEGKKSTGDSAKGDSGEGLAKNFPAEAPSIDPTTGLPVQLANETQQFAAGTEAPVSLSSATSQGATADPNAAPGTDKASDSAILGRQTASSSLSLAPAQSVAENEKPRSTVLGDEPMVGKLFHNSGKPQSGEKLAELAQSDRQPSIDSFDLGLTTNSIPLPAIAEAKDGNRLAYAQSPPTLSFDAASGSSAPDQKASAASNSRGYENYRAFTYQLSPARKPAKSQNPRTYEEKKKELDDLQRSSQMLALKMTSEGADTYLPKSTMVEIVDKALPAQASRRGFLERITGKPGADYESVARLRIDTDSRVQSLPNSTNEVAFYDPYFVQTETEVLQSDVILGRVVDKLNLRDAYAKKKGATQQIGAEDAIKTLRQRLDIQPVKGTSLLEIRARDDQPTEASEIANAVTEEYLAYRHAQRHEVAAVEVKRLEDQKQAQDKKIETVQAELAQLRTQTNIPESDPVVEKPAASAPIPQPEIQTRNNAFSTFSLNVSDVSFKLAAASLEKGVIPQPAGIRAEEFINAFDYRDPEPTPGTPFGFVWERARYPFAQNRDILRLSLKTASQGRQAGRPLNLVLLLDNSGSMERADRVRIIHEALRVLAAQLQPQDTISVVTFARTARLWVDGVSGDKAAQIAEEVSGLTPQGGTNLEEAMNLGYQTALRHYRSDGINRVVLLTDGAANLGDVDASRLKGKVETNRKQGVAFDCFGIGWEGYNDDLLETLSRNGDGRYGFLNTPEEVSSEFAAQLAGALQVAAADVKVQVEFNPDRVSAYRQIGYAKHQLTKEQFRDNTVDAAELGAAESGNALYVVEVNPAGVGPLATVRVRSKVPGTAEYQEHAWAIPYAGNAAALDQSSPAMRLACAAGAFAEWLSSSPYAAEITPDALLSGLRGIPDIFGADPRPKKIEWMIRQAKSLGGK